MTEVPQSNEDPNIPIDDDRNRPIHVAAAGGDENWVCKELNRGAKVDVENYLGWTPLMMATRNGHLKVATLLLQYKADATKKNKFGISVFHLSIAHGSEDLILLILQTLLRGGVSRLSMESVLSPFSVALLFNRSSILTMLMSKSFNINAATLNTAVTPLMFAAALNNMAAYQLLLTNNANPNLKNVNQQTAQDIVNSLKQQNPATPQPMVTQNHPPPPMITLQPPMQQQQRPKTSSNVMSTPTFFISPMISPIAPHMAFHHQVFFPPDFSPGRVFSPMNLNGYASPDMHYQGQPQILSPFAHVTQIPFYPSPHLNERIDPMNGCRFVEYNPDTVAKSPV